MFISSHASPQDIGPQNTETFTTDPVIRVITPPIATIPILPPADVDAPNYTCHDFVTKLSNVCAATQQDSVYTASFCDEQTNNSSCPCIASDSKTLGNGIDHHMCRI